MKVNIGDYRLVTNDNNFIIQKKKIIQASKVTKPENVGKESWIDDGYFSNFDSALKYVSNRVLLDNDDLSIIKNKLVEIHTSINEIKVGLGI